MARKKRIQHEVGSANVIADLELDDSEELLTRAQLGYSVRAILKEKKLKQREVSDLLGIDQAEVSKLMSGKYHLFAEGRLFGFLNKLDRKVTVQVAKRRDGDSLQEVVFV